MSFIEGVGDEVIHFFGILLLICVALVAWWSTNISEFPHIRTVLIVERRTQNTSVQQPNLLSQRSGRLGEVQGDESLCRQSTLTVSNNSENKSSLPVNSAVNVNNESSETSNSNSESGATVNSKSNSDNSRVNDPVLESNENMGENNTTATDGDNIRIRLKYLNDDQKLVEGRLQELLGDFKRRHFRMELAAQKLVRLIFNGQVLVRDEQTLAGYGLYDNCVVHCLVGQAGQPGGGTRGSGGRLDTPPPDWNLGGLLYACLSLALGLAWICWYNYSHLFTLTTTTALVGLTGVFAASIFGLYMHDQDTQATTN